MRIGGYGINFVDADDDNHGTTNGQDEDYVPLRAGIAEADGTCERITAHHFFR